MSAFISWLMMITTSLFSIISQAPATPSLPTKRVTSSFLFCIAASTTLDAVLFNCCAVITAKSNFLANVFNSLVIFFNSSFSVLALSAGLILFT